MTVIRTILGRPALNINTRKPPLDNVRVRQAIVMGIDRNAAIAVLQQGHASLGFLMPAGSPWELDQERGCAVPGWCQPADMEAQRAEAKKILQEEGFDFDRTYLMTVESDPQVTERATFVQEQLRLLGIKTDFDQVETIALRQQVVDGDWGDFMPYNEGLLVDDPAVGLGHDFRCDSIGYNKQVPGTECDEKMEGLLHQVANTFDPMERKRLSDEIQLHAMKLYWKFPLFWEQEAQAFWPEVRGYASFPESSESFRKFAHMWIDPAHKDDRGFSGPTMGVPGEPSSPRERTPDERVTRRLAGLVRWPIPVQVSDLTLSGVSTCSQKVIVGRIYLPYEEGWRGVTHILSPFCGKIRAGLSLPCQVEGGRAVLPNEEG
jgi:hypothetical protein